ncbi:alpha/beta hydrolase [Lignipirellula cremea]|uniref:Acetylxylan esterase n=1 Tax=Lignipirellula cremea TaxID=2528010 RepID=A0A518E2Z5_9BACT|nr:alpha/beta hydrolase [Lignipirellula cremea]QDU98433.1 Acetylxylan esterase precursor [Lignipirellula cremea]
MRYRLPALMTLACGLLISPLVPAAEGPPTPTETLVYKTIGDTELKLHVFAPEGHKATDQRPAVVFFFGGGWSGGSPSQFYPHCQYLASRGIWAASAEYRVKSRDKTEPSACVEDGKSAVRYIRAHAKELGIDPDRLAAGGGSAGGHVAAATGTVSGFNADSDDTTVSARPNALLLFNPVYDNGPQGYGHDRVKAYWEEFSPLHNIDAQTPPTIVFLGDRDSLIPVATGEAFRDKMKAAGVRSDLHIYEGQPHGFFNQSKSKGKYFNLTVIEADKFLAELGWLQGEPTLKPQAE